MQSALIAAEVAVEVQDERKRRRLEDLRRWRARRDFQKFLRSPLLPQREVVFGALFFKTLYFLAERHGYTDKSHKALHILTFRRFLMRFYNIVDEHEGDNTFDDTEVNRRMRQLPTWIGWEDLHRALDPEIGDDVIDIKVRLNNFEWVIEVLEGNNSILGYAWSTLMTVCILTSLAIIVLGERSGFPPGTNGVCILMFTVEYLVRLVCSPWCRRSLVDPARIYGDIVPSHDDSSMGSASSKTSRFFAFVLAPMNLVDLISIIPWWLEFVIETSGFKLGFLRSARLIRLVRLMKVGGLGRKFEIMCEVFARSWGSIAAIAVTLCVLSLMFGALMAQLEGEPIEEDLDNNIWIDNGKWVKMVGENGTNVPLAMMWVAGRLTGMQSNMPHKKAIPANWCNQVIVHILGIMKGFVFLLPLGQIKQISKDEDQQWQDMDQLEYEVASDKKVKAGEEWSEAFAAPYATVEVFEAGEDEEIQPEAATHAHGRVNLPVGAGKRSEVTSISFSVITGLVGSDLLHDITSVTPGIFFEVAWAPVEGSDDKGTLTLTPIETKGFPAPGAGRRWKLRVGVHETMFGPSTRKCMSLGAAGAAEWDESVEFSVDWSQQQDGQAAKDQQAEQDLGTLKDRLDRQSIILEALEDVGRRASQASQGSKGAVRKKK